MSDYAIVNTETGAKEIAESLADVLTEYGDRLTEQQIKALPLLAYGAQPKDIAKHIGATPDEIRQWLSTNMDLRAAVARAKTSMRDFHKQMLDQAGAYTWSIIFEKLTEQDVEVGGVLDEQRLKIAIEIMRQLSPGKSERSGGTNINVPILHIGGDSADLIAQRLHEISTPDVTSAEYHVVQDDFIGIACAPGTYFGEMSMSGSGLYLCHICGQETHDIIIHARNDHQISPARYRKLFKIPNSVILNPIMDEIDE